MLLHVRFTETWRVLSAKPSRWFGHFILPFAGLLSRHVKRRLAFSLLWAVWPPAMHAADLAWIVLPDGSTEPRATAAGPSARRPRAPSASAAFGSRLSLRRASRLKPAPGQPPATPPVPSPSRTCDHGYRHETNVPGTGRGDRRIVAFAAAAAAVASVAPALHRAHEDEFKAERGFGPPRPRTRSRRALVAVRPARALRVDRQAQASSRCRSSLPWSLRPAPSSRRRSKASERGPPAAPAYLETRSERLDVRTGDRPDLPPRRVVRGLPRRALSRTGAMFSLIGGRMSSAAGGVELGGGARRVVQSGVSLCRSQHPSSSTAPGTGPTSK